jgi:FKBP-type peptidyl-prolyl cis-trans isomerase FkpA
MKKIFLFFASIVILAGGIGCIKDTTCKNKSVDSERAQMEAYATANGIAATSHSSGVYYEITNPGNSIKPSLSSTIFVNYVGKRMDGTQFDAGTTPAGGWVLSGLIQGWHIGLPLIGEGGSIKLIIPSSLAYGCEGVGPIAGNSVLFFDITLTDVQ